MNRNITETKKKLRRNKVEARHERRGKI